MILCKQESEIDVVKHTLLGFSATALSNNAPLQQGDPSCRACNDASPLRRRWSQAHRANTRQRGRSSYVPAQKEFPGRGDGAQSKSGEWGGVVKRA